MKNEELKDKKKKGSTKKNDTTKNEVSKTFEKKNVKKEDVEKKSSEEVVLEEREVEEVNDDENASMEDTSCNEEKTNSKMGDIILVLGLVVVLVLGFLVMRDKNAGPSYTLPLTLSGEAGLQELSYEEYKEKVDNDDQFVLIIERATCTHCVTYMPIAKGFASDNDLPMYYVDTDTFTKEEWQTFEKTNTYLKKANGDWGTPTTMVLAGSETVDFIEGIATAEELLALYNEYFDMSEE